MTCDKIQYHLSAFVDGGLSAGQTAEITLHLARCPQCRAARERLDRLAVVLQAATVPAVPDALHARILAAGHVRLVRQQQTPALLRRLPWLADVNGLPGYMKAAASIVLLVGLGTGAFLGSQLSPSRATATVVQPAPDPAAVFGLEFFADAPEGSIAQAYLAASRVGER